MELRTLLRNGSPLSLLFSIASTLFLSPRRWYPPHYQNPEEYRSVVSVLRSQCPLCCASSRICSPSYAPRGAAIPCGLTRLRILPVATGVPLNPAIFSACQLSDTILSLCLRRQPAKTQPAALRVPRVIMRGVTAMRSRPRRRYQFPSAILSILTCLGACCGAPFAHAQERRDREPNTVYADRRAKLAAQVECPIVLWGLTGREESSQAYILEQEENFYYLTGHNEEGAGLIILPPGQKNEVPRIARETLFLPAKNSQKERWNGVRMSATDPGIEARTGFAAVKSFESDFNIAIENLAKTYPNFYTILPYQKELGGYPHEKSVVEWLELAAPQAKLKDIRAQIGGLRQIKSPGEIAFLKEAIGLTLDSHLEAMKLMRPGLYEYQVAAKMVEVHAWGGSEAEGYAPIVGAGPNSTALHYDRLSRKIEDGDIVVMDVAAQYAGYSADITRTIPANGKYTARQREIYNVVLGAQNAALAALKPGMDFCSKGDKSVHKIAYNYINSHGKDLNGNALGIYFIHGLGHHIGLNVHDAGEHCTPFQSGMVITIEPGIYIPEENLGVRIEDDVLITESGYKLLSEGLPPDPDENEKVMAEAALARAQENEAWENRPMGETPTEINMIRSLIEKYAKSVDGADTVLAAEVW